MRLSTKVETCHGSAFSPSHEILSSELIWLAKFLTSSRIYPCWARRFSLLFSLYQNLIRCELPSGTSRNITHDYISLLSRFQKITLSFSLFVPAEKTTPLRIPINPLNASCFVRQPTRCDARENARRGTAGKNRGPVKFSGKVVPRLQWPINMGKRRYARSAPREDFTIVPGFSSLSRPSSLFRSTELRNSRQFVAFRACEK